MFLPLILLTNFYLIDWFAFTANEAFDFANIGGLLQITLFPSCSPIKFLIESETALLEYAICKFLQNIIGENINFAKST